MTAARDDPNDNLKRAARRTARARRADLVAGRDLAAAAERLAGHVLDLLPSVAVRVVAYTSYGVEPPTHRLLSALVAAGHDVIVPVVQPDRTLRWSTLDGSLLGTMAISTARVVVTPGLAIDRSGTRLGQGGGSYDRALLHRAPDALVVTLLHDGELLPADALPHEQHDVRVHGVVTPDAGFVDLR